ncbi:hypothetical protein EHV15_34705 [Paenibacillus oralis]|uniref:Uncharacterized protein n=1 Tax=Paenibacillus oralis TaxID=2490856 RepID=A0A3P3T9R8_9BACL|nr:hypothetical protein [Paenibacillus oralis]RRJ54747.1 hypothetical protein EHV15_34705 [Paenibacillus oralis]
MKDVVGLTITRAVIEQKSTTGIERYFHQLTTKGRAAYQSVVFIFDGYNDTSEQVYEIKEVRDWVYSLFCLFPHLLYFINPKIDTHITLLACLGDVQTLLVGSTPLTPNQYEDQGIDMIAYAPHYLYNVTIDDDLFMAMDFALQKYGRSICDIPGASLTIKMIRGVTNR